MSGPTPGGADPPRTLIVVDELYRNGAVRINLMLADSWKRHGARVAAVRESSASTATFPVPPGVTVDVLSTGRRSTKWKAVPIVRRMAELSRGADVVLCGSEIGVGLLLSYWVARVTGRPLVIAVHADVDSALREWIRPVLHPVHRWIYRRAHGAICIAPELVPPLLRNGLPASRIRVVTNGIDRSAVGRAARETGSLVRDGIPAVVATGRLASQKGHDVLIRAHAVVVRDAHHEVLLLNDGPEREELQQLAAELGAAETVVFAGAIDNPLPTVSQATVFCLPSRHEGLPLALLEALTLGVPCIATDCSPAVREALADGRVGKLVPVEDVPALARALHDHLDDPRELQERARRGVEHGARYDARIMVREWARALTELTATRPPDRRRLLRRATPRLGHTTRR